MVIIIDLTKKWYFYLICLAVTVFFSWLFLKIFYLIEINHILLWVISGILIIIIVFLIVFIKTDNFKILNIKIGK